MTITIEKKQRNKTLVAKKKKINKSQARLTDKRENKNHQ